jgi:CRISPR system Cascade subunit CasA
MTYSFNLVDRNWIPCVLPNGTLREFSLRDVLTRAHELRSAQGDTPLETAALYRLLLAVLHSTLRGPRNLSEWAGLWNRGWWDPGLVNGYLDKWHDRFDLFHPEKPFYQAKDERVKPKSIISMVMEMAAGNMATLFDHHTEATGELLFASKAARTLLVAQYFGLAGLSGLKQKFTDGCWGRGVIFLVEGNNLFETLALNLLPYPDEKIMPTSSDDRPAWEKDDPHQPARQIPEGYLDYLTWQNRRILLTPEGDESDPYIRKMTVAPGLRLDASVMDPMKLYRAGKEKGYLVTRYQENRSLWRDSASLFSLKNLERSRPPRTFDWLAKLSANGNIQRQQVYRFMGLGMANDQAKVEFFREEHMPLPLDYLERDMLVEQLASALDLAEQCGFSLRFACQWLALLIVSPKSDGKQWAEVDRNNKIQAENLAAHWNVERSYWQQLEIPFLHFLEDLPSRPEALNPWKETIRKKAREAFEQAVGFAGNGAPALKAVVRARRKLEHSLNELLSEPERPQVF